MYMTSKDQVAQINVNKLHMYCSQCRFSVSDIDKIGEVYTSKVRIYQ